MKKINCIGIIMDGNRRWAKNKNLPIEEGHRAGYKNVKNFIKWSKDFEIKNIVVYIFSTENWKRNPEEVSCLMRLIREIFLEDSDDFIKEKISVKFIGKLSLLPKSMLKMVRDLEEKTSNFLNQRVFFAISYGGREEIVQAVNDCMKEKKGPIEEKDITKHLYDNTLPDPDIIVRTSGEMRLSGFLPWQSVYSELFFVKTLWPDFSKSDLKIIIDEYENRERRMGK